MSIKVGGSKASLKDHLEHVAKRRGKKSKMLDNELPEEALYLWAMFVNLKNASGESISYSDIRDYYELNGFESSSFEVEAIRAMDDAFREVQSK